MKSMCTTEHLRAAFFYLPRDDKKKDWICKMCLQETQFPERKLPVNSTKLNSV